MESIQNIMKQIIKIQEMLCELINQKGTLVDPKVIEVSQKLDMLIMKYDNVVRKSKSR